MHSILLYNDSYDDVYLVTRFLGSLKEDICAPIALHHPKDVDTASALALLREEELEPHKHHLIGCSNKETTQPGSKVFSALDHSKSYQKKEEVNKSGSTKWGFQVGCSNGSSHGLCFTCGDKWTGKSHKCPAQIPQHVVQEMVDLFQLDISSETDHTDSEGDQPEDCVMVVQNCPEQQDQLKHRRRKTMRFKGMISKKYSFFWILVVLAPSSAKTWHLSFINIFNHVKHYSLLLLMVLLCYLISAFLSSHVSSKGNHLLMMSEFFLSSVFILLSVLIGWKTIAQHGFTGRRNR